MSQDRAQIARSTHLGWLRSVPGVTAVGVGVKETGGKLTPTVCIKVYVRRKRPLAELAEEERIPPLLDGVPTDVVEATFRATAVFIGRHDPLIGGVSIGNLRTGGAGTLGCVVYDVATREERLLSNYHVFSIDAEDRLDPVSQPGTTSEEEAGGNDIVGRVDRLALDGVIDAATSTVSGHRIVEPAMIGLGPVSGARNPVLHETLHKSGRTTGTVSGQIEAVNVSGAVDYPFGEREFDDLVVVRSEVPSSLPGDSGSVWIDGAGRAVVLNFAGDEGGTKAVGCLTTEVAARLSVDFASGMTSQDMIAVLSAIL